MQQAGSEVEFARTQPMALDHPAAARHSLLTGNKSLVTQLLRVVNFLMKHKEEIKCFFQLNHKEINGLQFKSNQTLVQTTGS